MGFDIETIFDIGKEETKNLEVDKMEETLKQMAEVSNIFKATASEIDSVIEQIKSTPDMPEDNYEKLLATLMGQMMLLEIKMNKLAN
ncbi:MAG: hypothetical protein ACRDB0_01350 [Paraclostridium sp.]